MKRYWMLCLGLVCVFLLTACNETEKSGQKPIDLEVNGALVAGNHFIDEAESLVIDATESEWIQTVFPKDKEVTLKELKREYVLVKEEWDKKENVYRMILLPEGFRYVTPEVNGKQTWVEAAVYPKGWVVNLDGYKIAAILTELIPEEDYVEGTDADGYKMGQWDNELLQGLPLPSIQKIEIIDFPNGHKDMDGESHYSLEMMF